MRHLLVLVLAVATVLAVAVTAAAVSNGHFVGTPKITVSGDTVTASGKVAGLGNVTEITVTVAGDAGCVNRGGNHPEADNKESFSSTSTVPVQNGKAIFSETLTATFDPDCSPPMSVEWSNVTVTVTAEDGTYLTYP